MKTIAIALAAAFLFAVIGACQPSPFKTKAERPQAIAEPERAAADLTPLPGESVAETLARGLRAIDDGLKLDMAKVKAATRLAEAKGAGEARADMAATTKAWTAWAMGIIALVGVASIVCSFIPWAGFLGLSVSDAVKAFAAVAAIGLLRYALLRWGTLAADIATILAVTATAVAAAVVGYPWIKAVLARRVRADGVRLAVEHPREGTAIVAAVDPKVNRNRKKVVQLHDERNWAASGTNPNLAVVNAINQNLAEFGFKP